MKIKTKRSRQSWHYYIAESLNESVIHWFGLSQEVSTPFRLYCETLTLFVTEIIISRCARLVRQNKRLNKEWFGFSYFSEYVK